MPPHLAKYRQYTAHFDLSTAQQDALIHMIYNYMDSFVSRAFGDDPTQVCLDDKASKNAPAALPVLDLQDRASTTQTITTTFNTVKGRR